MPETYKKHPSTRCGGSVAKEEEPLEVILIFTWKDQALITWAPQPPLKQDNRSEAHATWSLQAQCHIVIKDKRRSARPAYLGLFPQNTWATDAGSTGGNTSMDYHISDNTGIMIDYDHNGALTPPWTKVLVLRAASNAYSGAGWTRKTEHFTLCSAYSSSIYRAFGKMLKNFRAKGGHWQLSLPSAYQRITVSCNPRLSLFNDQLSRALDGK